MKSACRLILRVASPWCVAALPLMAHAETDACTLLTRAQVAAAVGGAVSGPQGADLPVSARSAALSARESLLLVHK